MNSSGSSAFGFGATITASNQIVIGRSTEITVILGNLTCSNVYPVISSATNTNINTNGATSLLTKGYTDVTYPQLSVANIFTNSNTFAGLNYTSSTVTVTSTLALPLTPIVFSNNGVTAITLTLPTPAANGAIVCIRLALGVTGAVTVAYSSIFSVSSTITGLTVANGTTSSYIYQSPAWFQTTYFV